MARHVTTLNNSNINTLAATLGIALASGIALADTLTVCGSGCQYTSINAAIADAEDGDVIQLSAQTYLEGEVIDTIGKAITIRGVLDGDGFPNTTLSGANAYRITQCVTGEGSDTIFENLILKDGGDGLFVSFGGATYNYNSSPTFNNCEFLYNRASANGGAVHNWSSSSGPPPDEEPGVTEPNTPTFNDCVFNNNTAERYGGAIYNLNTNAIFNNCDFTGNAALISGFPGGGAAFNYNNPDGIGWGARPSMTNCVFTLNEASFGAGAILNNESSVLLTSCRLWCNDSGAISGDYTDGGGNCVRDDCVECQIVDDGCQGDFNGDGSIDGQDLAALLAAWGNDNPDIELSGDDLIDGQDLAALLAVWGNECDE